MLQQTLQLYVYFLFSALGVSNLNPLYIQHRARALHKLRQPYRNHTVKCYATEL